MSNIGPIAVIVVWLAAAAATLRRRRAAWLGLAYAAVAALGAAIALAEPRHGDAHASHDTWRWVEGLSIGVLVALVAIIVLALPNGSFDGAPRRRAAALCVIVGIGYGFAYAQDLPRLNGWLLASQTSMLGAVAVISYLQKCRRSSAADRNRLQWVGWGVVVTALSSASVWLLHQLLEQPTHPGAIAVAVSAIVPLSLIVATIDRLTRFVEPLLVHTVVGGGLIIMAGSIYLAVVLGFTDSPTSAERQVLALALVAAALTAVLFGPVRERLSNLANRRVYGARHSPEDALQTFGSRMSRAIPLDELLLQLAESLRKSLRLAAAEVWTGSDGIFELVASVPNREPPRLLLTPDELPVVTTSHVSGNGWAQIWLKPIVDDHAGQLLRVAPMAHSGELLGLVVCARSAGDAAFSEQEDRVLGDLSRQVALALHNSRLDSALAASLEDLRDVNSELTASRARVVAAADASRRKIERNLHDGAQQHLVALAVKVGLVKKLLTIDPDTAAEMIDELRADVQTTLTELRELAHGIYPPLLRDRGLPEALQAAANRAVHPTRVDATIGRHPADLEAAVYFCCLEAIQNAGKHAGDAAEITVTVCENDTEVRFSVADTGVGFDAAGSSASLGHGFVNMTDRVGAIGGRIEVSSKVGSGTTIIGHIPIGAPVMSTR